MEDLEDKLINCSVKHVKQSRNGEYIVIRESIKWECAQGIHLPATTGKIANNGLRLSLHHRNLGYVAKRAKICITERRRCGLPILDLSCKKTVVQSSQNAASCGLSPRSPVPSSEKPPEGTRFPGSGPKSPYENRIYMVTPPLETESPKKMIHEPIYKYLGHPNGFAMLPVSQLFPKNNSVPLPIVESCATSTTSTTTLENDVEMTLETGKKMPRPFKAYPKDPLSLSIGSAEVIHDQDSNEAYSEFRKRMLESVRKSNEGTNIKMKRVAKSPTLPTSTVDEKDAAYWERRRKNNEAAKRSRDARRAKEDEIAIRAAFLEQENMKLKFELAALKNETAKLRCMIYSS
ncbi:LOW QUALITY PROTEIN: transcription factor giant [Augochlora pura]